MKLTSLRRFLDAKMSAAEFLRELDPELSAYRHGLTERGRSVPVPVTEDRDIEISRTDVATLCRAFLAGDLDTTQLSLIADVIQMADRVSIEDRWVADAVAECTDPEIQGEFTQDRARQVLSRAGV
jgi:hypothetical protein